MAWIRQKNGELHDIGYIHPPEEWDHRVKCGECGASKWKTFWRIRGGVGSLQYTELYSSIDEASVRAKHAEFIEWLEAGGEGIFTFEEEKGEMYRIQR